jgi:hypothetical protein
MPGKVPELLVERLRLGDLPADRAADVHARLVREPGGLARLEALRIADAEVLAQYPPRVVAAEVQRRAQPPPKSRLWLAIPALAVALLALWIVRPQPQPRPMLQTEDGDRVKGLPPRVVVYRKTGARIEPLAQQSVVHAGDLLQPGYVAAGHRFGALVSLDGRGGVTVHEAQVQPDGERLAKQAYELDDAPDFERFVLVVSDRPLQVQAVLEAARRLAASGQARTGTLGLPGTEEASLLLLKGPR